MQVQVISVAVEDKGKYKQAEVAYKDGSGKVTSKKLISFNNPDVFKTFIESTPGEVFQVTAEKNAKGYWDWTSASRGGAVASAAPTARSGNASPKSTYETPEERAARQVYIVRQSSISNAIEFLALNKKAGESADPNAVVEIAKFFERYVFGVNEDTPKNSPSDFSTMEDDIPY